ncbi:MAG TPA: hypothetical protein VFR76_12775, partial [Verrucomicrobiae bacterium]|nr:hypothetical protein [Verrucomicrobiae bacterium]
AHDLPKLPIVEQHLYPRREFRGLTGFNQKTGDTILNDFWQSASATRHNGQTEKARFGRDQAE